MNKGYQQLYFQDACSNGNLVLAKKLTKTYNLTSDDARSLSNFALRGACTFGHTLTAQWLVETFKLTLDHKIITCCDPRVKMVILLPHNGYLIHITLSKMPQK